MSGLLRSYRPSQIPPYSLPSSGTRSVRVSARLNHLVRLGVLQLHIAGRSAKDQVPFAV